MTAGDDAARAALRARQGAGARYDADTAPHADLLLARRGTAYFARKLNELSDEDLWLPSLREGWTRRRLIAHVGYCARVLALLVESVRTGTRSIPRSQEDLDAEERRGASLPAHALRHLVHHSAIHLDVEWRDLPADRWGAQLEIPGATSIRAQDTPMLRAKLVWQAARDLGIGGALADIPRELRGPEARR